MTERNETAQPAPVGQVERGVRPLREGEVMGAYIDFDRTADKTWTPAEYLVAFGIHVSELTARVNAQPSPTQERPTEPMSECQHGVPHRYPCEQCGA